MRFNWAVIALIVAAAAIGAGCGSSNNNNGSSSGGGNKADKECRVTVCVPEQAADQP